MCLHYSCYNIGAIRRYWHVAYSCCFSLQLRKNEREVCLSLESVKESVCLFKNGGMLGDTKKQ